MSLTRLSMTAIQKLHRCSLFIFDLDGTVYEEISHFTVLENKLAKMLPSSVRSQFHKNIQDIVNNRHTLSFGDGYHPQSKTIVKGKRHFTWTGHPVNVKTVQISYADDPWSVYFIVAHYYGLSQEEVQSAFLATRRHMQSDTFAMTPMPGLAPAIQQIRNHGKHVVLITNSPKPDSLAILQKLGLSSAFHQKVFNARKQVNAPAYFQRLHQAYQVPFQQMVSIGDHYRNEIAPAVRLGMQTVCIDRYQQIERPYVTVQLHHPNQLAKVLKQTIEL